MITFQHPPQYSVFSCSVVFNRLYSSFSSILLTKLFTAVPSNATTLSLISFAYFSCSFLLTFSFYFSSYLLPEYPDIWKFLSNSNYPTRELLFPHWVIRILLLFLCSSLALPHISQFQAFSRWLDCRFWQIQLGSLILDLFNCF